MLGNINSLSKLLNPNDVTASRKTLNNLPNLMSNFDSMNSLGQNVLIRQVAENDEYSSGLKQGYSSLDCIGENVLVQQNAKAHAILDQRINSLKLALKERD